MGVTADIGPASIGITGDEILEARDVVVRFGGLLALDRVNIALRRNEIFGLIGPNGAGKSTTVNVLTGFQQPTSGEVLIDGRSIGGWSTNRVARSGVARTFQAARLFPALSVFENVVVASVNAGGSLAALSVIAADTDEEARRYASDIKMVRIRLESGRTFSVGSLTAAEEFARQAQENYTVTMQQMNVVHGARDTVLQQLYDMQCRYNIEELILVTAIKDFRKRLHSYELLSNV